MNVNLDMVARDANNVLFAAGTFQYPFLKPYLEEVAQPPVCCGSVTTAPARRRTTGRVTRIISVSRGAGIPFIYFGVEDEAQHHKATDDAETVTREFFVGAANTILAALRQFDENLEAIAVRHRVALR